MESKVSQWIRQVVACGLIHGIGVFGVLSSHPAGAEIIEIASMTALEQRLQPEDLVIFDLDNTVMRAGQMLGSTMWFSSMVESSKRPELSDAAAFQVAVDKWIEVQAYCSMVPVEGKTPEIIAALQQAGRKVMALTSRNVHTRENTVRQLDGMGVNFSRGGLFPKDGESLAVAHPSQYYRGIVFCGDNEKGAVLEAFMRLATLAPKRVVMVDDRRHNLESVEKFLAGKRSFLGLRYSACDVWEKTYDAQVADLQLALMGGILSDRLTRLLLGQGVTPNNPR